MAGGRKSRASRRRAHKSSKSHSTCSSAGHLQSPKTHKCVTCKAFKTTELKHFSNLLGLSTRGKTRPEMCSAIRGVVQPAHFGELVNKIERRRSRVRDARRRASEKLSRGEPLFGGVRPTRKSIFDYAGVPRTSVSSSLSPFVGVAMPAAPSVPKAPSAPAPAKEGGILSAITNLFAPPSPASKAPEAPTGFDSYKPRRTGGSYGAKVSRSWDPSLDSDSYELVEFDEYDDFYEEPKGRAAGKSRGDGLKSKDWRDVFRELYGKPVEQATVAEILAAAPAAPYGPMSAPAPVPMTKEEVAALRKGENEFDSQAQAIQDFIRAYASRKSDELDEYGNPKPYYKDAGPMTKDFARKSNLTSDYGKWRREPWNFDFAGVDDGTQEADFAAAFRKGDEGFLSESSEGYF